MRVIHRLAIMAVAGAAALGVAQPSAGQDFEIPQPIRMEHEDLYSRMEAATRAGGATGEAARAVMEVLAPHFEKEEAYALPQLGLLPGLVGGPLAPDAAALTPAQREKLIARTEKLREELPRMLEEHQAIAARLKTLRKAAEDEGKAKYASLAEEIELHARMEEHVLYPTVLLIGDHVRLSSSVKE